MNYETLNIFTSGLSFDLTARAEKPETYQSGLNGRMYSSDGILSFSSLKGTIEIYNNPAVVKYLGAHAFEDQLVLIAKYDNEFSESILDGSHKEYTEKDQSGTWFYTHDKVSTDILLSPGLLEHTVIDTELDDNTPDSVIDNSNESCSDFDSNGFDLTSLYQLSNISVPNYEECLLTDESIVPQNNKDYSDVIIVITKQANNTLTAEVVWNGYLDLDINRKINMIGIDENTHYKRLYFTDSLNTLRTFNLKDPNLSYKKPESFAMFQSTNILQPSIEAIKVNGHLKSMSAQYLYRLITENGQVSSYSPFSELVQILPETDPIKFKGGDVAEVTNKSVSVKCPIADHELYYQIECFVLEFEVNAGAPTSIKSLGIKDVDEVVYFEHNGTESSYADTTILAEVLTSKGSWKYCSDLAIKKNRLIAGGLRNEPYPVGAKYMEDMFLLKGWDKHGNTHDCLINPKPDLYRYIDPANETKLYSVAKTLYTQLLGFGNFELKLINTETNAFVSHDFTNSSDVYQDFVQEVSDWLASENLSIFPNLAVSVDNNSLLFDRIVATTKTDLSLYQFESNTSQLIIEFDHEYELSTESIDTAQLTDGAVSYGFNEGTGIRLSWGTERDLLMTKDEEAYTSGYPYSIEAPSLKKSFMKNEIYRVSVNLFKDGNPLFAIPLGDIHVPKMGDPTITIDSQGERQGARQFYQDEFGQHHAVRHVYKNQVIENGALYAERVTMKVEFRLGCDLKDFVDSYQIMYVERTEENRTILAQGLAGPLQRTCKFKDINASGEAKIPDVSRKWTLPYLGGPLHEKFGFEAYDTYGEHYDRNDDNDASVWSITRAKRRIISNRRLMYFDAPDLIYGRTSENFIGIANANVISRLKTDHNREVLRDMEIIRSTYFYYEGTGNPFDKVPAGEKTFSRKLWGGGKKEENYKDVFEEEEENEFHPYWVNFSIFSNTEYFNETHEISNFSNAPIGAVIPSAKLDMEHEISNNAQSHGDPAMNYSESFRAGKMFTYKDDLIYHNGFNDCANISPGYKTMFLKTDTDLFTDAFLGEEIIKVPCDYEGGNGLGVNSEIMETVDSHALINLQLNNQDTVYGGRTRYAFSRNIFSPLGDVVPIHKGTNQSQITKVLGDTYVTLFMRTKNDFHTHLDYEEFDMNVGSSTQSKSKIKEYNRPNAWVYGVVLETTVEERMSSGYKNYREPIRQDFSKQLDEFINSAYYVTNNLKSYVPRPFNFKDSPLLMNILAASKTKLSGDFYDSFSVFLANDFHELERQYGHVSNLITYLDELYVLQSLATNNVTMDPSDTITTDQGRDIQVATGTGKAFHSHKIISHYGTSIRRAIASGVKGFSFYDEKKDEFVKITEPLATQKNIQLKLADTFENDKVIDTEGWYDEKYKETNINLKTRLGNSYTLSYNEVMGIFNGYYSYNNSLFANFDDRVFAPKLGEESSLHELNKGDYLNFFDVQKTMKLGIIVNGQKKGVKIFRTIETLINIKYPVKSYKIYDSLDVNDIRTIEGTHPMYKIREGIHTVPLQNMMDREPKRGEWAYIEVEIESIDNQRIDLFSLVTFLRDSKI